MKHLTSDDISKSRVAKWLAQAKPIEQNPVWTERRQAISFGNHTYLITNGQVFQCAHCGHYDPEWSAVNVLTFFEENFGIKPYEIEITCSVAIVENL